MDAGEEYYRHLFEFAPEAYVVTELDGTVRELNRVARLILGDATTPVVGSSLYHLVAESDREAFERAMSRLLWLDWPLSSVELTVHLRSSDQLPLVVHLTVSALGPSPEGSTALAWIIRPTNARVLGPKVADLTGTVPPGARDLARRVDDGLSPVVGAVGLSLRHPRLPAELKLALAQAAVALDGAVQWMGKLERVVVDE